ncbi:SMC N terminal domain-containing protein [Babesia ovis]|uniref:Structural maintenance of chromosomes protein 5 n=1 Tax=Babesia ovis TaxID=5869 RepID=A0A9W5WUZ1_BABOV|nr:SMC N terminal domain-containing protein [Babesia ovis]
MTVGQKHRFREGAIDSISMENWMAYTGPVRLKALPGVNIIAAANGCGKSAIVCAIAIGLGFETNVLSRGDNIKSFIKRGFHKAKLQIGLVDHSAPNGITMINRTITVTQNSGTKSGSDKTAVDEDDPDAGKNDPDDDKTVDEPETAENSLEEGSKSKKHQEDEDEDYDGTENKLNTRSKRRKVAKKKVVEANLVPVNTAVPKSSTSIRNEWTINGKPATFEMVKQLQKRLNIQVNNLLTFLAQANVGKFASLSPQQLFRSTLNAIQPSLCHDLDTMAEMARDVRVQRSKMQMLVDDLNATTVKIAQLKVISDTLNQIKEATLYANLVKQKLYRIKLNNLEKGYKATKTRINLVSEDYKRLKDEKQMLDDKLKSVTSESSKLLKQARAKIAKAKGINVLQAVKPVKHSNLAVVPLADDNVFDKVFYKSMTAMRTFAANNKPRADVTPSRSPNKDVLEQRLKTVNKQVELLKMQIAGENELTAEIAECRMQEETLKAKLHMLQGSSIRRYEDIQLENLLRKLNVIKRDGYRQFIRWRKEQLRLMIETGGSNSKDGFGGDDNTKAETRYNLPKLLISDMKVCGRVNCCIIEETAGTYMESLLLAHNVDSLTASKINRFNLPSLRAPQTAPVLCQVTDQMRTFGVKHFLHELVECKDPETKYTLASVARLGTAFVVDEKVFYEGMQNYSTGNSNADKSDLDMESPLVQRNGTMVSERNQSLEPQTTDNANLSTIETTQGLQSRVKRRKSISRKSSIASDTAEITAQDDTLKIGKTSVTLDRITKEEDYFRRFYKCMTEEISKQLGQRVHILRYYLGNKRHVYREFRDSDELYSDYSVEIPTAPIILHDCSNLITKEDTAGIEALQKELHDISDRLRVLNGLIYGRRQDNKAVVGRLYALSREQQSLERTLQHIDGTLGSRGVKDKQQAELEKMENTQRNEIKESITQRADAIMGWIQKANTRRTTLVEAQELYSEYKKLNARKTRLEDLSKLTTTNYEEIEVEYKRLESTLSEQEEKRKKYQRDITELNILIKAISGEMVQSTAGTEQSEAAREREALKIRQNKAIKLDQMTEGDLEREMQLAELDVKRLERDDCEETQNAKEMRDAIIHEEKLSTEIAQAEAGVMELNKERTDMFNKWLKRVNEIISQVDANFGRYMGRIGDGAGGQIRLEATMDNIKEAKVMVLVKFHADRDLLPLSASYQSGGERGVTTMVYILAVQHLTTNAFFVIDEINQGLDSNYEKRIMALLLDGPLDSGSRSLPDRSENDEPEKPTETPPPQYFVITPQLLPGIDLRRATMHFPLNGPGVINGMVL